MPQHTPATAIIAVPIGSGAFTHGTANTTTPASTSATPTQSTRAGRSPRTRPVPIMVVWTPPNSTSAPTLAAIRPYASVKATAYAASAAADVQDPFSTTGGRVRKLVRA